MRNIILILICLYCSQIKAQSNFSVGVVPGLSIYDRKARSNIKGGEREFVYYIGPAFYYQRNAHTIKCAYQYSNGTSDIRTIIPRSYIHLGYRLNIKNVLCGIHIHETLNPYLGYDFMFQNHKTSVQGEMSKLNGFDIVSMFPHFGLECQLYKSIWIDFGWGYRFGFNYPRDHLSKWFSIKYNL